MSRHSQTITDRSLKDKSQDGFAVMPIANTIATIDTTVYEESVHGDGTFHPPAAHDDPKPLMGTYVVNQMLICAANIAAIVYVALLAFVYQLVPNEEWKYLPDGERTIAAVAFGISSISTCMVLAMFYLSPAETGNISGIVYAGIVVMLVSMTTNGIMAFAPTIVVTDPVLHTRVFLVRWCEFIPLSGLMTFLCDVVDVPRSSKALQSAIAYSLCQTCSCIFGLVFPFCPGPLSWSFAMFLSFLMYFPIFPRLYSKYKSYRTTPKGHCYSDMERYSRHRYSYELMLLCTMLWTFLVVVYFLNGYAHVVLPEGHAFRPLSLAMFCDASFDVIAKSMYMRQIVESHKAVFQSEGLAKQQLFELRRLLSLLWSNSSDLIVLSIRHEHRCLSLFSPQYNNLLSTNNMAAVAEDQRVLVLELERQTKGLLDSIRDDMTYHGELGSIKQAYYIDSKDLSLETFHEATIDCFLDIGSFQAEIAQSIVFESWGIFHQSSQRLSDGPQQFHFQRPDGSTCDCELAVMPHVQNGMVTVVKDVSEKVRRREAERRATIESTRRQREAQSQSRFVRHEVKNGLLAGIELVDNLRASLNAMRAGSNHASMQSDSGKGREHIFPDTIGREPAEMEELEFDMIASTSDKGGCNVSRAWKRLGELDSNLRDVLDTVLAEAMARDVINEVYQARIEIIDVIDLLQKERPNKDRFPVHTKQSNFPNLQLDPQLLKFIHRNAVSNACKYGQQNGMVLSLVSYDFDSKEMELHVINSPGIGHNKLRAMGLRASEAVFEEGRMLHRELDINENLFISSGDGAWIAQKCARALGGSCEIKFEADHTFFSFRCPATSVALEGKSGLFDFEVPADTWAIAIDDSAIQRKLLSRILDLLGIAAERKKIIGEKSSDIFELEHIILPILEMNPGSKVLVIVDENLDYGGKGEEIVVMSGSRVIKDILTGLSPEFEERVLALVRSANDSSTDLATYVSRTHGFLPKVPMNRERVRETLAPLWQDRFHAQ